MAVFFFYSSLPLPQQWASLGPASHLPLGCFPLLKEIFLDESGHCCCSHWGCWTVFHKLVRSAPVCLGQQYHPITLPMQSPTRQSLCLSGLQTLLPVPFPLHSPIQLPLYDWSPIPYFPSFTSLFSCLSVFSFILYKCTALTLIFALSPLPSSLIF